MDEISCPREQIAATDRGAGRMASAALLAILTGILALSCLARPQAGGSRFLLSEGWESRPGILDEATLAAQDASPEAVQAPLISPLFAPRAADDAPRTYRNLARTTPGAEYALSIFGARSFAAIYIDGRKIALPDSGLASLSDIRFTARDTSTSILIQNGAGGPRLEDPGIIPRAVLFGKAAELESFLLLNSGLAGAAMGVFALGSLFMFSLFLFWRKNRDFLALSFFMLSAALFVAAKTGGCFGLLDAPRALSTAALVVTGCLQAIALARLATVVFEGKFPKALRLAAWIVPAILAAASIAIAAIPALAAMRDIDLADAVYLAASVWYTLLCVSLIIWLAVALARGDRKARWFLPALLVAAATLAAHRLFPASPEAAFFLEPIGLVTFAIVCMLMLVKKIGDSFEATEALTDYVTSVSATMNRFIPTEFLWCLDKTDVIDLKLGDHVRKEMTIFFSDIRAFTELSERLTVEENFNFINSYLSRVVPIVTANGGFVDKYIGDGIMALFEGETGPDAAIRTAIAMQEKMVEYNGHRAKMGYKPISMGVGVHTGDLMLGVIGVDSRMENTVISDAVNLSSRLQAITKAFNISLAISEQAFKELEDPGVYKYRFIGKVKVKGKAAPVSVFEIFDGIAADLFERKMKANTYFEQGMLSYYQKDFGGAMYYFKRVLEIIPEDGAAAFYLQHCMDNATI